jgi:hypothetical protein
MNRLHIIQSLINKCNAKKYLEIGVQAGYVLDKVKCDYKIGVDPDKNSRATLFLTSDEFFSQNEEMFDVIFIDGLHHADQVLKDIENSLKILNPNGYIVCHDMIPYDESMQLVPRQQDTWTGDCWKAWVYFRQNRNDLYMFVIDTDFGCGVIKSGNQELISINQDLNWQNFVVNKNYWMNIISVEQFLKDLEKK